MKTRYLYILACVVATIASTFGAEARVRPDTLMLHRIYDYAATVDTSEMKGSVAYAYKRNTLHVDKRNFTLLAVPSMYVIAHGGDRMYVSEAYDRIVFNGMNDYDSKRILTLTTVPHHNKALQTQLKYLTPRIYDETIIEKHLLSPFHKHNKIFYHYQVSFLLNGTAKITFRPKTSNNTQLVSGTALVDYATGRIINTVLNGEYDMIRFSLNIDMGKEGQHSLMPQKCDFNAQFKFLGNKISTDYIAYYGLPSVLPDSIPEGEDMKLMSKVRPDSLTSIEQMLYDRYYDKTKTNDTTRTYKKDSKFKKIMWDVVGDHLVNRIKSSFGNNKQGNIRIDPLVNPLYLNYSHQRGLTYRFDVRGSYDFSDNSYIWTRFKSGYSFKQRVFYFTIPMKYCYNKRRNGFVEMEVGNGNRISFNAADKIDKIDTVKWDKTRLNLFSDTNFKLINNYDLSSKLGMQVGFIYHKRKAVDKDAFFIAGKPNTYNSFAPLMELEYRPDGWKGPIFTLDYERSLKGIFNTNTTYERWEIDGQYVKSLARLQAVSMRLGAGFYTQKDKNTYFLDYSNFRENNIPGGWNDDWSGEFELLDANWYNESEYYVRANVTYESPLLLLSWVPIIGHFIETERIYASALSVHDLHPYVECGYGFTTRWVSTGVFVSNRNGKFDGIGCKIGFELFRHW